jgi:hypothetical protein
MEQCLVKYRLNFTVHRQLYVRARCYPVTRGPEIAETDSKSLEEFSRESQIFSWGGGGGSDGPIIWMLKCTCSPGPTCDVYKAKQGPVPPLGQGHVQSEGTLTAAGPDPENGHEQPNHGS